MFMSSNFGLRVQQQQFETKETLISCSRLQNLLELNAQLNPGRVLNGKEKYKMMWFLFMADSKRNKQTEQIIPKRSRKLFSNPAWRQFCFTSLPQTRSRRMSLICRSILSFIIQRDLLCIIGPLWEILNFEYSYLIFRDQYSIPICRK